MEEEGEEEEEEAEEEEVEEQQQQEDQREPKMHQRCCYIPSRPMSPPHRSIQVFFHTWTRALERQAPHGPDIDEEVWARRSKPLRFHIL